MLQKHAKRNQGRRGHSVVEVAFLAPWLVFLFAGAFDVGFYSHAAIATANAARAAALYTASSPGTAEDSAGACPYALSELSSMPNVKSLTACGALPLRVTATLVAGPGGPAASEVRVEYRSPALIPIPGLDGQMTFVRTVQMRL